MLISKITINDDRTFSYRLEISTKEAELLLVFRELIFCDFYVEDDFFEKKSELGLDFKIPLEKFWRPVVIPEHIETDLNNP